MTRKTREIMPVGLNFLSILDNNGAASCLRIQQKGTEEKKVDEFL
jgi:hypothetical protein